jgi:S-methylmethionine-dependent homocysteine/selenocysteine methylase
MMMKAAGALGVALIALAISPAVGAEQFQCPLPLNPNNPAKLEQIRNLFPDVNTMTNIEQLNAAITALRRDGMSKSLMIDHLVGAYCQMAVREAGLTDAEKTALVRRFTGQVTRLVYSFESGLDIILNVPLTPDVVEAVNRVARKQGLSGPAWIAMTIDDALQQQQPMQPQ